MDDQSASVSDTDTEDEEWVTTKHVPTKNKKGPVTASSTSSKRVLASSKHGENNAAHKKKRAKKGRNAPKRKAAARTSKSGTNKNKRKRKNKKVPKHYAVWKKIETTAIRAARSMPEHCWRGTGHPRNYTEVRLALCIVVIR